MTALGFPASASGRGFFPSGEERAGVVVRRKRCESGTRPNCGQELQLRCWTAIHRNCREERVASMGRWRRGISSLLGRVGGAIVSADEDSAGRLGVLPSIACLRIPLHLWWRPCLKASSLGSIRRCICACCRRGG